MIAMDNGYFLVKFLSKKDLNQALLEGPWMIADHYLIVRRWCPNFDPFNEKIESLTVWIRFLCLPIEYYDEGFLMKVGAKMVKPIRVNMNTSLVNRGHYARMCVEADMSKPLLSKFRLRRRVRRIKYDGLHLVCFGCGKYWHVNVRLLKGIRLMMVLMVRGKCLSNQEVVLIGVEIFRRIKS